MAVPPKPTPNPMANPFPKSLPPNGSAADTSPIPTQPKPILLKTQSTDYVVLASSPPPGHQSVIPLPPTPACSPPPNSGHIPGMLASPPIRVRLHKVSRGVSIQHEQKWMTGMHRYQKVTQVAGQTIVQHHSPSVTPGFGKTSKRNSILA